MPRVKFTSHLQRYFPTLQETTVEGHTVAEVVAVLDERYPGLADYVLDDQGALRKHVNIFIDEDVITDRTTLQDPVSELNRVYIFQALSGG
ncbi:MAG TPA: MoaD/ThiS family protein [Aggregatilinea sp.]|uniref:MoaD/ThiS family protein n=1 Tax=Aggregatilinea sp. TaxID=2806333 RepID=UPI002C20BC05|nr:MoaD/ThiS family protein [Aggregatilinea sp.]HML22006.1 MoaD/ThiS family protein [Aggregatilinea sp.]